jgi:Fe-S-cluster-containing dehydrogenase component/formate-dependent nitrite reductase membrane component NrfD
MKGRVTHQVGLPYHWGSRGLTTGGSANDLLHLALDPNVHIMETKGLTCDIRPGRRPRGRALAEFVARKRDAALGAPRGRRACRAGGGAGDMSILADPTGSPAPWPDTYGEEAKPRMGFFTDTTVCIGCKACEVACKEWNLVPEDGLVWTGESYDNTSTLGANSWRHVAFIEQRKPLKLDGGGDTAEVDAEPLRWLVSSDVCKHCTHAGCLDVCPTGSLFRTEFGTVVVQEDICNGCGYCVPACPFGVLDKRHLARKADDAPLALPLLESKEDGRVWKCTLCYDRLKGGQEPACAKACPTDSIQFGRSTSSGSAPTCGSKSCKGRAGTAPSCTPRPGRRRGRIRGVLHAARRAGGVRPAAGSRRADEGPAGDVAEHGRRRGRDRGGNCARIHRRAGMNRDGSITAIGTEMDSYYGRPILKEPVWQPEIPFYFFTGGIAGASSVLHLVASALGNKTLARRSLLIGAAADVVSPALLVSDLGRPERAINMFRVFKVTSPMSVGSWILLVSGGASNTAAVLELVGKLKPVKLAAELVSALAGGPLATYTGTLIADTSIPVWHEARNELPWLFGASAAASAGAAAAIAVPPSKAGPARRLAIGGTIAELTLMEAMRKRLGFVGEVYQQEAAGKLARISKACAAAGAAVLATTGKRSRAGAAAGGTLALAGELALRWSVFRAGFQSARDPQYVVHPQRERKAARGANA